MKRIALLLFVLLFSMVASAQVKELVCTSGANSVDVRLDEANSRAGFGHQNYMDRSGYQWSEPNWEPAIFTSMEVRWGKLTPDSDIGNKYKLNRTTGVLKEGSGAWRTYKEEWWQCEIATQKF